MKALDAPTRVFDRLAELVAELRVRGGKLVGTDREIAELAAIETACQRTQRGIAIGAHLRDQPTHLGQQVFVAERDRTLQRRALLRRVERGPMEARERRRLRFVIHASIFSTGSTSN